MKSLGKVFWILSAVAWLTAACGLSSRVALPSWRSACPTGQLCSVPGDPIHGVLRADAGCLWLQLDDGREAGIAWPPGYTAEPTLVAVFDPSGRQVARAGDVVTVGGTGPTPGTISNACGRTLVVEIGEIIDASSS